MVEVFGGCEGGGGAIVPEVVEGFFCDVGEAVDGADGECVVGLCGGGGGCVCR